VRPARDGEEVEDPPLTSGTVIRDAVPRVLRAGRPVAVVDGTERLGVVDAEQLLPALLGHRSQVAA
jgi:glycine betaine/proline transport system ATP-binding protein